MVTLNTFGVVTMEQLESVVAIYVSQFTGFKDIRVHFDDYDRIRIIANSKLILDFYFSKLYEVTGTIREVGIGMTELFSIMAAIRVIETWPKNSSALYKAESRLHG